MTDIIERLRKGATHGVLIPCEDLTEAADEIDRLRRVVSFRQRAERLSDQAQSAWRPIETAPRDGTVILLGNVGSEPRPAYYGLAPRSFGAGADKRFPWTFLDCTNGVNHCTDDELGPTHWMPLPAPPSADARPERGGDSGVHFPGRDPTVNEII
jgi:hypothetical protein